MAAMSGRDAGRRKRAVEALTAESFRPFGDVIARGADRSGHAINAGSARRLHDLARIDVAPGGHAAISLVRAEPRVLPFRLQCLERHVHGSQAFVPLDATRWLVVVCPGGASPRTEALRIFVASAGQGVNYARATWHHPLIAIDRPAEFVVVDRVADDAVEDCEIVDIDALDVWIGDDPLS
jgi:ureidoglycolate lyase